MDLINKKVFIFDIDGTLVELSKIHICAYVIAFKKIIGVDINNPNKIVKHFGKSEIVLIKTILKENNIHNLGEAKIKELIKSYESEFLKFSRSISEKNVLRGVKSFLKKLRKEQKVLVVYSGNPRSVGKKILKNTGLNKYFNFQIYFDDLHKIKSPTKKNMLTEIINQVKEKRQKLRNGDVILFGDSQSDIEASKQIGIDCLAVCTGYTSKRKLYQFEPKAVIDNFTYIKKYF